MASFSTVFANPLCHKTLINLFRGWPHPSLLAPGLIHSCAAKLLSNEALSTAALYYGPEEGDARLRTEIAQWLASFYGGLYGPAAAADGDGQCAGERISISGGASQSLANILTAFTDPIGTRRIWMIAPAYALACRTFEDAGFHARLRTVPEDDEGLDVEYLRREIEKVEQEECLSSTKVSHQPRKRSYSFRYVIFCVPTFSNPSAKTMSLSRREELVRLARKFDALLISDDVYDMLYWPTTKTESSDSVGPVPAKAMLPRLIDIDRALPHGTGFPRHEFGNAISNGTFSKLIGPGLRTGWVAGSPAAISTLANTGATRSGGAPSHFTACIIAEGLLSHRVQGHIESLKRAYAARWRIIVDAIETFLLPLGVRFGNTSVRREGGSPTAPGERFAGGYFLWLELPQNIKASTIAEECRRQNLIVAPGDLFEVPGVDEHVQHQFRHMIRICYAWETHEALTEGIERLASILHDAMSDQ